MPVEENIQLMKRWFQEVWNEGKLQTVHDLLHPDGVAVGQATGKPVRITGTTIARIENGQVMEGWDNWDQMALLEQIGAYKAPEAMALPKSA